MKNSLSFKNLFTVFASVLFSLALAGCLNPFLQLGSEDASRSTPGIVGLTISPPDTEEPDIEEPGEPGETEETEKVVVKFHDSEGILLGEETIYLVPGYNDALADAFYSHYDSEFLEKVEIMELYGNIPHYVLHIFSPNDISIIPIEWYSGYTVDLYPVLKPVTVTVKFFYPRSYDSGHMIVLYMQEVLLDGTEYIDWDIVFEKYRNDSGLQSFLSITYGQDFDELLDGWYKGDEFDYLHYFWENDPILSIEGECVEGMDGPELCLTPKMAFEYH